MRISDWSSDVCSSDLGTVSRQVPSVCLHIVFLGDMALVPRDMFARNGGNLIFLARNHEIYGHDGRPRCATTRSRHGSVGSASRAESGHAATSVAWLARQRSEERRVGTEGVRTCRSRWWRKHNKTKTYTT